MTWEKLVGDQDNADAGLKATDGDGADQGFEI